ncbi:hypothetical protein NDU88_008548 [Pleurodeles waltl]|uniref:Secreted protein n=1 Tax=Pleurodeles waltl TaxID=8319 RepID=A0AAV7QNW3_PLEWA|nr:hypothetical protein NDU88_008548 [Pleurodeles waltl]
MFLSTYALLLPVRAVAVFLRSADGGCAKRRGAAQTPRYFRVRHTPTHLQPPMIFGPSSKMASNGAAVHRPTLLSARTGKWAYQTHREAHLYQPQWLSSVLSTATTLPWGPSAALCYSNGRSPPRQ